MKTVTIIGAGFSGLTLAYFLVKRGIRVEIFEEADQVGGLIGTKIETLGLVETAANGIYNTPAVEELFAELGIAVANRLPTAKRRYIFRGRPRRWPLSSVESLVLCSKLVWNWLKRSLAPRSGEAVAVWGRRIGGEAFTRFLLAPALRGIYAGDVDRLSAELIFGRRIKQKQPVLTRGTVAPEGGMSDLMLKLSSWLTGRGVVIKTGVSISLPADSPVVIATSAWTAASLLSKTAPEAASALNQVESLPLVSVTQFLRRPPVKYRGFGCLFPQDEKFHSLGVLFNSDIFAGRAKARSETWILGGALCKNITGMTDEEILRSIAADRARLFPNEEVEGFRIHRIPRALPHYTLEWRNNLQRLKLPKGIYLTGNYLGQIGLGKILDYNLRLASEIHV